MRVRRLAAAIGLVVVLTACTSPPAGPEGVSGSDGEAPDSVDGVLAAVEGLTGQARRDRLVQLAEEAGDGPMLYTSLNSEIAEEVLGAFEEATGITPGIYRASSETVRQRLSDEFAANAVGADVIETNGPELVLLSQQGVLSDITPPNADQLLEGTIQEGWTGTRNNIFTAAWNTNNVPADQAPREWTDLADPRWDGTLVLEPDDAEWYMGLYTYMTEQQGRPAEEVDAFFQAVAQGSVSISGHTNMRNRLIDGDYNLLASDYSYGVQTEVNGGEPVAWQPAVEPLLSRPNGAGVPVDAPNPAAGLLFYEWLLAEGQQTLQGLEFTPVRRDLTEVADVEVVTIDLERYIAEADTWQGRYEELISQSQEASDR
jgi:iron(III) transport system substrate-binding protein